MVEPLDEKTRERLRRQRRRDTKPEIALRSALHRRGLRFRIDKKPLPKMRSRADILFGPAKVAVFVDGCFWHCCAQHGSLPSNNREWWDAKLASNVERDRRVDSALVDAGWCVIRVWEHEDPLVAAAAIADVIAQRKQLSRGGNRPPTALIESPTC